MVIKNRLELAQHFSKLGFKTGAEIGVSCGMYSQVLCEEIPGLKLYCIDAWAKYKGIKRQVSPIKHEKHYEEARGRLNPYGVVFKRMLSMDAVKEFKDDSLDFVFIDGNHQEEYVFDDITRWSKKVRRGGIVSGHDYYNFAHAGVIEAVTKYLSLHHEIKLNLTTTHRYPRNTYCFWWVKQ